MELAVQDLKMKDATEVIEYDGEDPYQMIQVHDLPQQLWVCRSEHIDDLLCCGTNRWVHTEELDIQVIVMELAVQDLKMKDATEVIEYDGEDPYQMIQVHDYGSV
jgi:hypothetical protein